MKLQEQQDFLDREIKWKKQLLEKTADLRKRESIEKDLDTFEALRETMRRHRAFIDAVHTVKRMPQSAQYLSDT
jgi:hypothetical protein